jgi:hypothetical protein
MKIAKEQLPKSLQTTLKKLGYKGEYIEGYFWINKEDPNGRFMTDKGVLFECTRYFVLASNHLLMVVNVGIKVGDGLFEVVELTVYF